MGREEERLAGWGDFCAYQHEKRCSAGRGECPYLIGDVRIVKLPHAGHIAELSECPDFTSSNGLLRYLAELTQKDEEARTAQAWA